MIHPLRRGLPARLLAFLLVLVGAPSTDAQRSANPHDARVRGFERDALRYGARAAESGRALLPMLEIERLRNDATPGVADAALVRLAASRRLLPHVRAYATMLRGLGELATGDPSVAEATFASLGYVREWMIVGAFDNEGKTGLDEVMPPEAARSATVDRGARYPGREREVGWRAYPAELSPTGYVSFDATLRPWVNVCAFAETFVDLPEAGPHTLWFGAAGAAKVWFNGEEILRDEAYRNHDFERFGVMVPGRRGANRVLVKVCTGEGSWGFSLRMGDRNGAPLPETRVRAQGPTEAAPAPASPAALPDAPVAPLANLEALVEARPEGRNGAAARFDLARFLLWTGAQDEASRRGIELAAAAAELDPSVAHLLFASEIAETRAERMRFVAQAEERSPRDPAVRLARAQLVATGPDPGQALRTLSASALPGRFGLDADWLLATLYERRDLPRVALAIIDRNIARTGGAVSWVRRKGRALDNQGRRAEAFALTERVLRMRPDDFDAHRTMVGDAQARGETDRVLTHLAAMRRLAPQSSRQHMYEASVLEGLGRQADALDIYRRLIEWTPEEASFHVRYGDALLRFERTDEALAAFRTALALRPQDAGVRTRVEQLQPTERPDENRAVAPEEFLARRTGAARYPMSVLHDLTVTTVYATGLTHRFRQYVFQVHDEEGAREARVYGIPFEPGTEWVDVRSVKTYRPDGTVLDNYESFDRNIGQAAYRVYYDMRQRVLRFPELEPGDVVEVRYRVDDVSRRNAFGDYFGALSMLQRGVPVRHLENVIVAPVARTLHFNDPTLPGLTHEESREGDTQLHRFVARDVAPLQSEPSMPGATEVAPYLHVSTYATWEDVGRWWWGLARDQLRPDAGIERTVRELTADLETTEEKVAAIYAWVTENTRYVGLEFGIHGFKPYRVTQVVDRGFGDCKDTASLIYVMLKLAGVDARIALIRTSNLGLVGDAPASLSVFNHAIAYVPELDLFLDGTTDTHGMRETPGGDQGALTLVVGPETAELRVTPYVPADQVRRERRLDVRLRADGSAEVRGEETVTGSRAGSYRRRYQAAATRRERLQETLGQRYPGIEITEESFEELDPREPVRFRYEATVPQMAQRASGELLISPGAGRLSRMAATPTRRHPLMLGPPGAVREVRTIALPAGHGVARMPEGGEASSRFGRVSVRYAQRGSTVEIETNVVLTQARIAPDEYEDFRGFVERADALLRERVAIRPGGDL